MRKDSAPHGRAFFDVIRQQKVEAAKSKEQQVEQKQDAPNHAAQSEVKMPAVCVRAMQGL